MMIRLVFVVASLAAIGTPASAGPDPMLGASVNTNVAAQVVDPHPDYRGRPFAGTSGRRMADAMIRYQTGKLKPLIKTNGKTDLGGQGGASDEQTVSIPLISTGSPN